MNGFGFTRRKRVTDPLDDKVKARITGRDRVDPGCVSSGSEHSAESFDDVISSSLSELVFFGDDQTPEKEINDSGSEVEPPSTVDSSSRNADSVEPIVEVDLEDEFRNVLEDHVSRAISDGRILRRSVMAFLRSCGYDAAVCKTKWESGGGITAGSHEFVDVVSDSGTRYIVDLEFRAEFAIVRPTRAYERLLRSLPAVFVGKSVDLKRILEAVSGAARRSLRSEGLNLPPWRKYRFVKSKWLGSYRRTTNLFPASTNFGGGVECRVVGFDVTDGWCCPRQPAGDDLHYC